MEMCLNCYGFFSFSIIFFVLKVKINITQYTIYLYSNNQSPNLLESVHACHVNLIALNIFL